MLGAATAKALAPVSEVFPNRVAAGDVTVGSAVLWAHVTQPGPVRFEVSTNANFTGLPWQGEAVVIDSAIPVKSVAYNLWPGTTYYYRVTSSGGQVDNGTFRTPHLPPEFHGVHFGVSGDWRGELAPYPSIANAGARDLDFFVALGDTIYADYPSPAVPSPQARTLAEYRAKHNEVYSARFGLNALGDLRRSTAFLAMMDDHEVINNYAGGASPTSDSRFETNSAAFINETELFRHGLQAFHEFNPIDTLWFDTPNDPRTHGKPKLYRSRRYGRDAAIFLLDTRSFRDSELPPVRHPLDAAAAKAFNWGTFDLDSETGAARPPRTMLGARQLQDLEADLLAAKADGTLWKFILLGEPVQNLGFATGEDRFEGYGAERTALLRFISDQQIRNVVFISADIHGTVVNNVTYQLGPEQSLLPSGAFEVVTGSVAHDQPFAPTAFDAAAELRLLPGLTLLDALLHYVGVTNRTAWDSLPLPEKDRLFKKIMDVQLTAIGFDPTGLEGSDIRAALLEGGYVAAHTFGWTEFEVDPISHWLTVTTYGIPAYAVAEVNASILDRVPQVVSRFQVQPQSEAPHFPSLQIQATIDGIRLWWPASAGDFVLQARRPSEADWTKVTAPTNSPATDGTRSVYRVHPDGSARWFRLWSR